MCFLLFAVSSGFCEFLSADSARSFVPRSAQVRRICGVSLIHSVTSLLVPGSCLGYPSLFDANPPLPIKPHYAGIQAHLKSQIEVFITTVFLRVLESENSTFEHKRQVLDVVTAFSDTPQALVEIFLTYDCDLHATDLYNRIVNALSKVGWLFCRLNCRRAFFGVCLCLSVVVACLKLARAGGDRKGLLFFS